MAATGKISDAPLVNKIPGVSPSQLSVINPATLRAEAQAVDIQIKLAELSYQESTGTASMPANSSPVPAPLARALVTAKNSSTDQSSGSTASSTLSVDQALQELSQ